MAWAEKIPGSGRWRGLYRDSSGRKRTAPGGPYTTKAQATRAAGAEEDDARRRPGQVAPKAGKATWGTWADVWWPRRKVEPGTLSKDVSRRACHLEPWWGTTRLDTITRERVQEWVDELHEAGLAPGTVRNCLSLFSGSLKAAVLAGRIHANPCVSIELHPEPLPDARYLTWDEVEAITHFMPDRDALLVWLLVGTGARWGEAVGAHLHRLDVDRARLDVHEVWDNREREIKPYPKGRRQRSVPLPGWLVDRLTVHLHAQSLRVACGSRHRPGSRCRSGLVIAGRDGKVVAYEAWRRNRWVDACARAGLPNVRIHDLRHTYASWLIQDGVTIEAVSDLLGHASIATTERYKHLADTQWGAVRAALDARGAPIMPHADPAVLRLRSSQA